MNAKQIALPFPMQRVKRRQSPNVDLIGRSYLEGHTTVTVIGLCHDDDTRVIVERHPGGRTWSMPAWLMRLMFEDRKRKRAA